MKRYPGLSPFTAEQKDIFFGRDNDIKELSKLIFIERKVLLYSKSGYGKTSLLNAGVIPRLKGENAEFEFITIRFTSYNRESKFTPNNIFLQTIKKHTDFAETEKKQTFLDTYASHYKDTYWFLFKKNQVVGKEEKNYILVFDQFEELFSYPSKQIKEFYYQFAELIKSGRQPLFVNDFKSEILKNKKQIDADSLELFYDDINVQCVFSMRSDRLSELNMLADKITDIQKVFYELQPLTSEQARQAITVPAQKEGDFDSHSFEYETKAIQKILDALTNKGNQKIETTQLQIVCQRIELNLPTSKGLGNVKILETDIPVFSDIFLSFYNEAITKVTTDDKNAVRQFIEDQLIIEGKRISLDQFVCQRYVNSETLDTLVDTRLLRAERNSVEGFSYELSHDTLVPPIREEAKERIASERDKKRRRRILIITAISLVTLAIVLGLALTFFNMYQKAIENDRKFKKSQYDYQLKKGDELRNNFEYQNAIKEYKRANDFDNTNHKHKQMIDSCVIMEHKFMEYSAIKTKADSLYKIDFIIEASELYLQADSINTFEPKYTQQRIKTIAFKLKNGAKNTIIPDEFTKRDLEQAQKLMPQDKEIKEMLKTLLNK